MPIEFEGHKIRDFAKEVITQFGEVQQVQSFDNESIRKKYGDLYISEAYRKVDEAFLEIYRINEWMKFSAIEIYKIDKH